MSRAIGAVMLVVGLAACNPLDRFHPKSVNVPPPPTQALADDDEHVAWAESER